MRVRTCLRAAGWLAVGCWPSGRGLAAACRLEAILCARKERADSLLGAGGMVEAAGEGGCATLLRPARAAPPVSQHPWGPESGLTRTSTASEVRRRGRAPAPGGHQTATCSEAKWPAKTRAGSSRQMLKAVPHASGDAPGSWSSEGRVAIRPRSRSAPTSIQAEGATHTSCRTEARDSCGSTSHDRLGPWRGRMP